MPRLPTLRTRVLQELARQVRFQSEDAARRQLGRAEELALQLLEEKAADAPAAYPEEWVVFRITGLRTETGGDVVVREALLGDLPALIDRLSAAAKLRVEDLEGEGKVVNTERVTGGRAASDCLGFQGSMVEVSSREIQGLSSRRMALRMVTSLRMHATRATFGSLPAARSRR